MKEWVLENTKVTSEQYDKYINSKYKEYSNIDFNVVSTIPKKRTLYDIQLFSLNPSFLNALKLGIKKKGKSYFKNGIEFQLLSDFYKDENLFTSNRYGKCALQSIKVALLTKANVVTAICTDFREVKILHTFLIGYVDNFPKPMVWDYTMNLVMSVEDYYNLCDVEVIKFIKNDDFRTFLENIKLGLQYGAEISSDEFLIFPEEINEAILKLRH